MSQNASSISVVIPTYNRAEEFRVSLEALCALDRGNIDVEFIIVDNNSTDHTGKVIGSFKDRLPIRHLFQAKAGKNAALNLALEDAGSLGDIVAFTDDDVSPRADWLQSMIAAANRNPEFDVFGGKSTVVWPVDPPPKWALHPSILGWGFSCNEDIGAVEQTFPKGRYPVGTNYWVRRGVLAEGLRFDEKIGPVPENRIIGDETKFCMEAEQSGHKVLWVPDAVTGHRVHEEMVTEAGVEKRACYLGRTGPNLNGLDKREQFERCPLLWKLGRRASMMRYWLRYKIAKMKNDPDERVIASVGALRGLWHNKELLRLAKIK